jgi:DNA-binding transcriptional LysR family regulator
VELRHLQYFVAVAEERHFGRAAQRVGIEQSPLSRAIKALERDLGIRLLDRSSRGTGVTPAGEDFLSHARRILAAIEQARSAMQVSARLRAQSFRIGLTPCGGQPKVAELLARARTDASLQEIVVTSASTASICDDITDGILDCGITTEESHPEGIVAHKLWSESLAIALPANHRLAALPAIAASDLNGGAPIYVADPHAKIAAWMTAKIQALAQGGLSHVEILPNTELLLTVVGSGQGIGITSEGSAAWVTTPRVVLKKVLGESNALHTWLLRKRGIASRSISKLIRIARALE